MQEKATWMSLDKFSQKIAALKDWKYFKAFLLILFIVLSLAFNIQERLRPLVYGQIDPSYNYGVNQARADGLEWGEEYISTYGPLGFLINNYLPANQGWVLAWGIFYGILIGFGVWLFYLYYLFDKKTNKLRLLVPFLLLLSLSFRPGQTIEWSLLALFLLYCFIYLHDISKNRSHIQLVFLAIFAVILFFVRFSLGVAALAALYLLPLALLLRLKKKPVTRTIFAYIIAALSTGVTILVMSWLLNVDIVGYLKTNVIITAGYSEAMSFAFDETRLAVILLAACLVLFSYLIIKLNGLKWALGLLFILPILYTIWRYSIVRQDGHMLIVLYLVIPLVLIIASMGRVRGNITNANIGWLVCILMILALWANRVITFSTTSDIVTSPIINVINQGYIRAFDFDYQTKQWEKSTQAKTGNARLSAEMKTIIGDSTVDIFPWETTIVGVNNLHWRNRPSPYSFASYDARLDNINSNFFVSARRPNFIVWHASSVVATIPSGQSIDNRALLWDEPKTIREIVANYGVRAVDEKKRLILLQEKLSGAQLPERKTIDIKKSTVSWGTWVDVPTAQSGSQVYIFGMIDKKLPLKLKELAFRSQAMTISLEMESGRVIDFRFVPRNMENGLLVSQMPETWEELTTYLNTGTGGEKVKRLKFDTTHFAKENVSEVEFTWRSISPK